MDKGKITLCVSIKWNQARMFLKGRTHFDKKSKHGVSPKSREVFSVSCKFKSQAHFNILSAVESVINLWESVEEH